MGPPRKLVMDNKLKNYLDQLIHKTRLRFPSFDKNSSINAEVLAILQDPGNSGAEISLECSLNNNDPTAKRQREIIRKCNIEEEKLLMWNFYSAFDLEINKLKQKDKIFWAEQVDTLIESMPRLKIIIVFGKKAWEGMYYIKNKKRVSIVSAPHPSNRGMTQVGAKNKLLDAWKSVHKAIY